MLNILKKGLSLVLVCVMLFSALAMNSFATDVEEESENQIMPRFSIISSVSTSFTISGINSTSSVLLTAKHEAALHIKIEFQKKESTGYKTLETWRTSGIDTMIALEETRLINIFADYRIKVTCTADTETHTTFDYP